MLPFSKDEFFGVFATYNPAIFRRGYLPSLGLLVVAILLRRPDRHGAVVVSFVLSLMWIWTGIAYHWLYFAAINPLAQVFAVLFVAQGLSLPQARSAGMAQLRRSRWHPRLCRLDVHRLCSRHLSVIGFAQVTLIRHADVRRDTLPRDDIHIGC